MAHNNTSPFGNRVSGIGADALGFTDSIAIDHQRRLAAYRRFWLFYLGNHWTYSRDPGDPTITLNYSRRITDVVNDFTFKKGFKIAIPDDPLTPEDEKEDREFVRKELEETWRRNNKELWLIEAGQQGAVTGDLFARVSWEAEDDLEDPFARVDIIPSQLCFPTFGGPNGVDRKKVTRMLILTPTYRETNNGTARRVESTAIRRSNESDQDIIILGEEWVAPIKDREGKVIRPATVQFFEGGEATGAPQENPLGEIPVVHIPNYPLSGEFYGISDLVDVVDLNRELNEKATDISDVINYHGSPTTVLIGAKVGDLQKGANRLWGLPENATVKNLQLEGDLAASNTYWKMIKESMLELSGVPEQSLGKMVPISNTSAVALQISYMPLMEKRTIKTITYGLGIRRINRLILKIKSLKDSSFGAKMDALGSNRYRNTVKFPDPMPQDEAAELEKSAARLELRLSTRKKELEREGLSQKEVDEIIEGAEEEQMKALELENIALDSPRSVGSSHVDDGESLTGAGSNQLNRGGFDSTRGQKIAANQAQKIATGDK